MSFLSGRYSVPWASPSCPQPSTPRAASPPSCTGAGPRLPSSAGSTVPENPALRSAVPPGVPASTATHMMRVYVLPQQLRRRWYPDGPDTATPHSASVASSARLVLADRHLQPRAARFCPAQRCGDSSQESRRLRATHHCRAPSMLAPLAPLMLDGAG
ncbi:hypothetical protein NDU88_005361 [Pleurodeles waltl]|uniref:Uncharacterized protein n=1 Tax=Pleurodeles waltl TaxID=8319 RepID=A0AAV7RIA4_PLEWA|nr:hypothetical protein NDU88_005361 [Pleurodeles waltl]